jgi:site-specific DNA-methyltransferase (adenine-specific)
VPDAFYWTELATVYQADALVVLRELPAASADAVITDPPYSSGGQFRSDRIQGVHTKYVQTGSGSGNRLPAFTGDNRDQHGYGYWCALWLGECRRIVVPGGVIAVFCDWRQLPVTSDMLQAAGIVWRGILPWHKPNGRPVQGRWANQCEYVVWGTNGPRALGMLGSRALAGFLQANPPRVRDHITQKPLQIMRELVKIAPVGGVVLDPFAGAGTTGVAALHEGRRFVGVEQDPRHCATIARNLDAAQLIAGPAADVLPLDWAAAAAGEAEGAGGEEIADA